MLIPPVSVIDLMSMQLLLKLQTYILLQSSHQLTIKTRSLNDTLLYDVIALNYHAVRACTHMYACYTYIRLYAQIDIHTHTHTDTHIHTNTCEKLWQQKLKRIGTQNMIGGENIGK